MSENGVFGTQRDSLTQALIDNATLRDRIATLESRLEQARTALEDFAKMGIRHDLHPTMHEGNWSSGSQVGYSVGFVYGYLDSADKGVRERAKAALQALREGGEG